MINSPKNNSTNLRTLDLLSIDELEAMVKEFPYSSIFAVMLAKKKDQSIPNSVALSFPDSTYLAYNFSDNGAIPTISQLKDDDFSQSFSSQDTDSNIAESITVQEISEPDEEPTDEKQVITESPESQIIVEVAEMENTIPMEIDYLSNETIDIQSGEIHALSSQEADSNLDETLVDEESLVTEDIKAESHEVTSEKTKKKKGDKFKLKEYAGISDFSLWLLSFEKEDVAKKIKKEEKAAKKRQIEENAKKSVTKSTSIISEPLAEILASQGHLDDAKKMYEQLMLKYPEKSSYFAAKINNLIKF